MSHRTGGELPEDFRGFVARAAWSKVGTLFLKQRHQHQYHHQRFIKLYQHFINQINRHQPLIFKRSRFPKIITVFGQKNISPFPTRRALSHTGLKRLAIGLETALLMDSPKAEARWPGEWMKS